MKKVLVFLVVAVALACNCISQVPTQTIYAGPTCTALLPDYTQIVTVSDNCEVDAFTQTPVPGTVLNVGNPQVNVVLRVTDVSGNQSQRNFNVVLLDTIAPVFNFPAEMLSYTPAQVNGMYLAFETYQKEMIMDWAFNFPWQLVPYIPIPTDTVWVFQNTIQPTDEEIQAYKDRQP